MKTKKITDLEFAALLDALRFYLYSGEAKKYAVERQIKSVLKQLGA